MVIQLIIVEPGSYPSLSDSDAHTFSANIMDYISLSLKLI